jgi:hypothetical protein
MSVVFGEHSILKTYFIANGRLAEEKTVLEKARPLAQ